MGRIEQLAKKFEDHISLPWQSHLATAEKTVFVIYPKEEERRLRAKRPLFQQACERSRHGWVGLDLDSVFPEWMAAQDYAADYFEHPADLRQKLENDFTLHVASVIKSALQSATANDVVGVFGVGTLFGFVRVSTVLKHLEGHIPGRLVVLFPGSHDHNTYHLLDARDGWGYLVFPISLHEVAYT